MTQVIWVDSRMRVSGASDSDFEVSLRESVNLSDTRVRVDKLTCVDSFLTTDAGQNLHFPAPGGGRYAGILKQIDEHSALFDFNHPLAGHAVRLEVRIIAVL